MPRDLTNLKVESVARAYRALAHEEEEAAERIENPG
jgi:hypothetical protein